MFQCQSIAKICYQTHFTLIYMYLEIGRACYIAIPIMQSLYFGVIMFEISNFLSGAGRSSIGLR
mgnify:CR=1 FL=1